MYIIKWNDRYVGPFKTYRSANSWLGKMPSKLAGGAHISVILEPLEWSIFEAVLMNDATTSITSSKAAAQTAQSKQG